MRPATILALVLFSACSKPGPSTATDAAVDVAVHHPDAAPDAANVQPDQGRCASCTAMKCLPQLQACGNSQGCLNDLITFNNCLQSHGATCGTTLSAGGGAQSGLWGCLSTMCVTDCGMH